MSLRRTHNRKPAPTAAATDRLAAVLRAGLRVGAPDPEHPKRRMVLLNWVDDTGNVDGAYLLSFEYFDGRDRHSETSYPSRSGGPENKWTVGRTEQVGRFVLKLGFSDILNRMFNNDTVRAFGTRVTVPELPQFMIDAIQNDADWTMKNTLTFEHPPGEWHVLGRVVPYRRKGGPITKNWACPHAEGTPAYAQLFETFKEYVLSHADDENGPVVWLMNERDGSVPS